MNGIGPITDTDRIAELERESAEVSRVLFLRRQNSTKATITATTSKAAAPPPMTLASVPTGDVFCDGVDVFDDIIDVSGVVQLVFDGSDDALCTVGVPVIVVGVVVTATAVVVIGTSMIWVLVLVSTNCCGKPTGSAIIVVAPSAVSVITTSEVSVDVSTTTDAAAIVPLLMPLMIIGGELERRKRRENTLEHAGAL
jgi:hypothetical protein